MKRSVVGGFKSALPHWWKIAQRKSDCFDPKREVEVDRTKIGVSPFVQAAQTFPTICLISWWHIKMKRTGSATCSID